MKDKLFERMKIVIRNIKKMDNIKENYPIFNMNSITKGCEGMLSLEDSDYKKINLPYENTFLFSLFLKKENKKLSDDQLILMHSFKKEDKIKCVNYIISSNYKNLLMWWEEYDPNTRKSNVSKEIQIAKVSSFEVLAKEKNPVLKKEIESSIPNLIYFCKQINNRKNIIIKETPNKPFKPVKWIEDRTFYSILSQSDLKIEKQRLRQRLKPQKRSAHFRRSHCRILRHPRFGKNVGKIIEVKSTFVGDKELKSKIQKTIELN